MCDVEDSLSQKVVREKQYQEALKEGANMLRLFSEKR